MIKIFIYEMKRLLWNKFFLILTAITYLTSWYTLTGSIIRGVAYTAPFSPWSFGVYLAQVMPILLITLLFFLTFLYSAKEKRVKVLTTATKTNPVHYLLIRLAVMLIGYLLLCLIVLITALVFYLRMFHWSDFHALLLPALIILIPPMLFILGLGITAGRIHTSLIYAVMALLLLYPLLKLNYNLDFIGGSFFGNYPLTLDQLDPGLVLPAGYIASRLIYALMGLLLLINGCRLKQRPAFKK